MDKQKIIKAAVATFIVLGSVLAFGVKFWADGEALNVDRPDLMKNTANGNVSFRMGNALYIIDGDGLTERVIKFSDHGINSLADFDFFSNGDILFYNQQSEPDFLESLAHFFRMKELRLDKPVAQDGLFRCSIDLADCKVFSSELPAFHLTFRLFIDRESDDVYIADTTRFKIHKLNSGGELLASSEQGLRFPNQILLYDNKLYIANTNKHAIKIADASSGNFIEGIKQIKINLSDSHTWPTEIIRTPQHWWVGVSDASMSNGRLLIYDNDWNKVTTPLFDANADASSMALHKGIVWVSDWSNIKIYGYDLYGKRLPDLQNNEINTVFAESQQTILYYQAISRYAVFSFAIVFALGLFAAFVLEKKQTVELFSGSDFDEVETDDLENPPGKGVYWIQSRHRDKLNKHLLIVIVIVMLYAIGILLLFTNMEKIEAPLFLLLSFYFPIIVIAFWAWRRVNLFKIGISGSALLIDDGQGNVVIGQREQIQYNRHSVLVVDGVAVVLGKKEAPLFPKEDMDKWVSPRMLTGEKISSWAVQKILWKQKHPSIVVTLLVFGLLAGVFALRNL